MLTVLNVVDLLKYWHKTYNDDNSPYLGSSSQDKKRTEMKRTHDIVVPLDGDHTVVTPPPKFGRPNSEKCLQWTI